MHASRVLLMVSRRQLVPTILAHRLVREIGQTILRRHVLPISNCTVPG